MVYTLLSGFAPAAVPGKPPATGGLSDFNSQTGSWPIYLVMSVLAEFATVLIYTVVGITTPLGKDYASSPMADDEQSYSLKPV